MQDTGCKWNKQDPGLRIKDKKLFLKIERIMPLIP